MLIVVVSHPRNDDDIHKRSVCSILRLVFMVFIDEITTTPLSFFCFSFGKQKGDRNIVSHGIAIAFFYFSSCFFFSFHMLVSILKFSTFASVSRHENNYFLIMCCIKCFTKQEKKVGLHSPGICERVS